MTLNPVLYELDSKGEATGIVFPFCSPACLHEWQATHEGPWSAEKDDSPRSMGFTPSCCTCGNGIGGELDP